MIPFLGHVITCTPGLTALLFALIDVRLRVHVELGGPEKWMPFLNKKVLVIRNIHEKEQKKGNRSQLI